MGKAEIESFLMALVNKRNVSSSKHRQALSAPLFLSHKVLGVKLPWMKTTGRPREVKGLLVTLSPEEVARIFQHMDGEFLLIAQLLYGTGLRILEAMRPRVKDVDFTRNTILVRSKGEYGSRSGAAWRVHARGTIANIRARGSRARGIGCFRSSLSRPIRAPASSADIMYMKQLSSVYSSAQWRPRK